MRIVLFAYQAVGHAVLEELLALKAPVAAVFTHADDPGEKIWFPSVAALAAKAGIPVFTPAKLKTPEFTAQVAAQQPELFISAYYRRILPLEVLRLAPRGGLNLHGSLLPKYRGAAPANWQLVNGEAESGATLHGMSETVDQGAIIDQARFALGPDDTIRDFYAKLLPASRLLIRRNFTAILSGRLPAIAQDESQATVFPKRRPADGEFRWEWPALRIHDLTRAVTHPFPGAFFLQDGARVRVWKTARVLPGKAATAPLDAPPGYIVSSQAGRLELKTGAGHLWLESVQTDDGAERPAAKWAADCGLTPGKALGAPGGDGR